jgi:uncharacterized protein (TIGR02145 family)
MNNSASEGAQGICPNGWHVPSISDYNVLITYLGGTNVAGKKMKSIDANYWDKITFNDNSSGFNAHGGGNKNNSMYFFYKAQAKFWTSTQDGNNAKEIQLESDGPYIFNSYGSSKTAIRSSCRCVKNATTGFNDLNNNIEFNIYPNPTSGIINFNIEGLESQSLDLIIYNSFGQTIVFNQIQNGKIDMNSYCDGLYFYCLKSRGKVIAKGKFIKQ